MATKWYKIYAPQLFNQQEIGQTTADEAKKLIGRTVEIPLSTLFRENRGSHNILIKLVISEVKENKALTSILSYSLKRNYLVRLVRRGVSRIDSIEKLETKDSKKITVKAITVTRYKATREQKHSIRKQISELIKKQIPNYNWEAFILSLMNENFQKSVKRKMKKTYPIRYFEIRKVEVL